MATSLEWMLAARYLAHARPRTARLHIISGVIALLVVINAAVTWYVQRHAHVLLADTFWRIFFQWSQPVLLMALVLVAFFIALVRRLTIFSTISTYGLFLGTGAMVVVLSVMSGFEKDIRRKILGANAHIVVTAPDRSFTDWAPIEKKLHQVKGVVAVSPFISNEVMISSQSNLSGVVLKGIDPTSAATVTDLGRNLEQGSLENLAHPEKLDTTTAFGDDEDAPKGKGGTTWIPIGRGKAGEGEGKEEEKGAKGETGADPKNEAGKTGADPKNVVAKTGADSENEAGKTGADPKNDGGKAGADPKADPKGEPKPRDELALVPAQRRTLPVVLIGRELAKNLRTYMGDEVNVVSPMGDIGPTGTMPRSRPFRVGGVFYSGMYEYDSKSAYMSIPAAQKFLGLEDEITGFELKVKDADETERPVEEIKRMLGPGYEVQSWQELNRHLFSALKIEQVAMFVVLCFVILVASFSIVANGIMLVRERGKEIAILKSMGISDGAVLRTFLYMGLFMGGIGPIGGIRSGVAACIGLRRFGLEINSDVFYIAKLPVEMNGLEIAAIAVAAVGIALVAIVYPALVAAHLRPVEGLRPDHG